MLSPPPPPRFYAPHQLCVFRAFDFGQGLALEKGIQNNKASILHRHVCENLSVVPKRPAGVCVRSAAHALLDALSSRVCVPTPNGKKKRGVGEVGDGGSAERHHGNKSCGVISGAPSVKAFHSHISVYGNATGPASRQRSSCEALSHGTDRAVPSQRYLKLSPARNRRVKQSAIGAR